MLFKNVVFSWLPAINQTPGACYEKLLLIFRFTAVITYPVAVLYPAHGIILFR